MTLPIRCHSDVRSVQRHPQICSRHFSPRTPSAEGPRGQVWYKTGPTNRSETLEEHLTMVRKTNDPLERGHLGNQVFAGVWAQWPERGMCVHTEDSRLCLDPHCQYFDLNSTNPNVFTSVSLGQNTLERLVIIFSF